MYRPFLYPLLLSLIARQRVPLHAQHWLRHNAPFHFRKRVILHRGLFVHSRTIHVRVLSCIYRMNFSERRARAREREKVSARVKMNRFAFEARSTRQPQFVCSRGILVTGFRRVIGPGISVPIMGARLGAHVHNIALILRARLSPGDVGRRRAHSKKASTRTHCFMASQNLSVREPRPAGTQRERMLTPSVGVSRCVGGLQ